MSKKKKIKKLKIRNANLWKSVGRFYNDIEEILNNPNGITANGYRVQIRMRNNLEKAMWAGEVTGRK